MRGTVVLLENSITVRITEQHKLMEVITQQLYVRIALREIAALLSLMQSRGTYEVKSLKIAVPAKVLCSLIERTKIFLKKRYIGDGNHNSRSTSSSRLSEEDGIGADTPPSELMNPATLRHDRFNVNQPLYTASLQ
ncbi:hypothetical protein TNCV_165891 [Trichonephila clavipes]|nr:hypothetical protein TNCV_165891 [Trichonephila clavipes]